MNNERAVREEESKSTVGDLLNQMYNEIDKLPESGSKETLGYITAQLSKTWLSRVCSSRTE